jgi:2-polyprenyl-3-methyl-5-hydroxy-6-metoxy-1,4-benzoquinol methylase
LECLGCGLLYLKRREVDEGLYDSEHYYTDKNSHQESKLGDRNFNRWVLDVLEKAVPGKGSLLEVGCGVGLLLEMAKERGWQISGLELSPWAARHASERLGLSVRVSKIEDNPFKPESFDAVVAAEVLEHTERPDVFLSCVKETMKMDGVFLLSTPNADSFFRIVQRENWLFYRPGEHLQIFRAKNLVGLLASCGLNGSDGRVHRV